MRLNYKLIILLTCLLITIQLSISAQIKYEKGYIITNEDEKISCFIKNVGWKNNPKKIQYKLKEDEKSSVIFLNDIKEFKIPDDAHFIRKKVTIDRSPDDLDKLTDKRSPLWSEELLMLKVIVRGTATLYYYEDKQNKRFFFQKNNSDIEQLIYKAFLTDGNKILYNKDYQQQLRQKVSCKDINEINISLLKYDKKDLAGYFEDYNDCIKSDVTNYLKTDKKLYNIKLSAGITNTSLSILNKSESSNEITKYNFDAKLNYRIGTELELILPFLQNKWGLLTEISYQDYYASTTHDNINIEASYKYYDIFFGVRHYFYLSQNTKLFIDAGAILSLPKRGSVKFHNFQPFRLSPDVNSSFNFGFEYNRMSLICSHSVTRNIIPRNKYFEAEFSTLSLSLGYKIF